MSNDIVDFAKRIVDHAGSNIRVCMPAKIETYDYKTQKASIKIDMKELYSDKSEVDYPVVSGVPVIFPNSGGASITMPVKTGDTCLVMFADRDISGWLLGGQKPESLRSHALTDAVAILGLKPFTKTSNAENNDDLLISYAGSSIKLKPSGVIVIESTKELKINSKDITINCENVTLTSTNNVTITSELTSITSTGDTSINCENAIVTSNNDLFLNAANITAETGLFKISGNLEVAGTLSGDAGGELTTLGIDNTSGTITTSGKVIDTHKHKYDRPVDASVPFDTGVME